MLSQFDIVFYRGTSLISRTITTLSKSRYSHVALVLDDLHTLECDYKTPTAIRHFDYKDKTYDVYELVTPLTDEQRQGILKFIRENLGKKYDWRYIFSRGLNFLFGTKIYNHPDRYDCDELIVDAFKSQGIDLVEGTELFPEVLSKSKHVRRKETF